MTTTVFEKDCNSCVFLFYSFSLNKKVKQVLCSDEVLQKDYFISAQDLVNKSDLVIIATPHSAYKKLDIKKPLVDIWQISKGKSII